MRSNRLDHILRQRNNLLKQAKGRLSNDLETSLTIWNEQLVNATRVECARRIHSPVWSLSSGYQQTAGRNDPVTLNIEADWRHTGLAEALVRSQDDEVEGYDACRSTSRRFTHILNSLPSRSHASQGEQRAWPSSASCDISLHRESLRRPTPVLLDDVLNSMKHARRLVECLPNSQIVRLQPQGLSRRYSTLYKPSALRKVKSAAVTIKLTALRNRVLSTMFQIDSSTTLGMGDCSICSTNIGSKQ